MNFFGRRERRFVEIHKRIIATGREWKPCCRCSRTFEAGEILTAVDVGGNAGVQYWFCEQCTEIHFGHLLRQGWRGTWKIHRKDGAVEEVDWNKAG